MHFIKSHDTYAALKE